MRLTNEEINLLTETIEVIELNGKKYNKHIKILEKIINERELKNG